MTAGVDRATSDPALAGHTLLLEGTMHPVDENAMDVLRLVARGNTIKAIARQLKIAERTVFRRLEDAITQLDVDSREEALVKATRLGLLDDRRLT